MSKHEEGVLARGGGAPSLYWYATSADQPRAIVGLLHGYAEHGERYMHVMDAWADRGITTVAIDLRGHGRAEGRRGHCDRFEEYLDDAAELERLVVERLPDVPAILFGHSFGGLIAATVAIRKAAPWRALLLSGPFFDTAKPVPAAKRLVGRIASRLAPTVLSGVGGVPLEPVDGHEPPWPEERPGGQLLRHRGRHLGEQLFHGLVSQPLAGLGDPARRRHGP